ncbi:MAG TPA: amidohydrolase [Gemmatimonadaceae bacterium]|nr:amidohydrolase [Gemmatimonadaceae bacterium]
MSRPRLSPACLLGVAALLAAAPASAQQKAAPAPKDPPRVAALKRDAVQRVDSMARFTQQMVDQIFSFGELGFQEVETSRYLVALLRREGFTVEEGISGIPTAWMATWGSGGPVIALGSDIDGIPKASQKPGVAYHDPLVAGAPGHGEGHNSGQAVNVTAAIAVKRLLEREKMPGTIKLWPGAAEELVAAKAYFARDGVFRGVDAVLFSHVASNLGTSWGSTSSNGLVSVEYRFAGVAAHAAGAPWRGRSALDAVELMNIGWNYRREHLRIQQRSHYVIPDGGDQPNVVPTSASVWYYFRETDYPGIKRMWATGDSIAQGAAMMTGTRLDTVRVLGAAWPQHFNRPIAEAMTANAQLVGLPRWSEADQTLARAIQREVGGEARGLDTALTTLDGPVPDSQKRGGGSDDIGDVSWVVPTVTLRFPSNIPGLPGHHWANAVSMATPIAHKGATAGAKVMAMTMLDLMLKPKLMTDARRYFAEVQTRDTKYEPLIRPTDRPHTELNADVMARYREQMRKYYYDPTRYGTYLEQLGITYPTVRPGAGTATGGGK